MKRATLAVMSLIVWSAGLACSGSDAAPSSATAPGSEPGAIVAVPVTREPDEVTTVSETSIDAARGGQAVELISSELVAHPRADADADEARCVARLVVDSFGVDRLTELGLDLNGGAAPELTVPPMTAVEGDHVYAAYDHCLVFAQRDIANLMAAGLSESEARCASERYRSAPVPKAHLLLENHDEVPHDDLHAEVEALWEDAQLACRG